MNELFGIPVFVSDFLPDGIYGMGFDRKTKQIKLIWHMDGTLSVSEGSANHDIYMVISPEVKDFKVKGLDMFSKMCYTLDS